MTLNALKAMAKLKGMQVVSSRKGKGRYAIVGTHKEQHGFTKLDDVQAALEKIADRGDLNYRKVGPDVFEVTDKDGKILGKVQKFHTLYHPIIVGGAANRFEDIDDAARLLLAA